MCPQEIRYNGASEEPLEEDGAGGAGEAGMISSEFDWACRALGSSAKLPQRKRTCMGRVLQVVISK